VEKEEIYNLLQEGLIEEWYGPWFSPIVRVKKKKEYTFDVVYHRPGRYHISADSLSRLPYDPGGPAELESEGGEIVVYEHRPQEVPSSGAALKDPAAPASAIDSSTPWILSEEPTEPMEASMAKIKPSVGNATGCGSSGNLTIMGEDVEEITPEDWEGTCEGHSQPLFGGRDEIYEGIFMMGIGEESSPEPSIYVDSDFRCERCNSPGAEHLLVICSGCSRGMHTYCMRPAMRKVPRGDWYCSYCL
jgi:hypothetical protein